LAVILLWILNTRKPLKNVSGQIKDLANICIPRGFNREDRKEAQRGAYLQMFARIK